MKTIRCDVNTARPSSYRGAFSFLCALRFLLSTCPHWSIRDRDAYVPVIEADSICVDQDALVRVELDRQGLEGDIERVEAVHASIWACALEVLYRRLTLRGRESDRRGEWCRIPRSGSVIGLLQVAQYYRASNSITGTRLSSCFRAFVASRVDRVEHTRHALGSLPKTPPRIKAGKRQRRTDSARVEVPARDTTAGGQHDRLVAPVPPRGDCHGRRRR